MKEGYTNKKFFYTNPDAYDQRLEKNVLDKYAHSLWHPILLKYIDNEIKIGQTVCDLGCGTFIYTQHMEKAGKIYAVDINRAILDYGLPKIKKIKKKVVVLCEDGTNTSIPANSCDIVWIDGLSEFLDLDKLFAEIKRISKSNSQFIILFQNKIHPFNILVSIAYVILGRTGKKYRTIYQFKKTAYKYGFKLTNFESTGIFFYIPEFMQKYFIWLWLLINYIYQPFQKAFPIGINILCKFKNN